MYMKTQFTVYHIIDDKEVLINDYISNDHQYSEVAAILLHKIKSFDNEEEAIKFIEDEDWFDVATILKEFVR